MAKQKLKSTEAKILMIMMIYEYVDYLLTTKEKDYFAKVKKQLSKDKELSDEEFVKKYKPLWKKLVEDKDFDKYIEEKPVMICSECGSANCECLGKASYSKKYECQFYWWKCHSCGDKWEASYKEEKE